MNLFSEIVQGKKVADPQERVAPGIERKPKSTGRRKGRSASVSTKTFSVATALLATVVTLVVLALIIYLVYLGVMVFIPSQ